MEPTLSFVTGTGLLPGREAPSRLAAPELLTVQSDRWTVHLADGGRIEIPRDAFPRLRDASDEQLREVEFSPVGLHWRELDEDLSLPALARRFGVRSF